MRCPDRVSVDSGPSFASEKGSILRIFCNPPFTAVTAPPNAERIPFAKVETTRCPDWKNQLTAPETALLMLFRPFEKAARALVSFCLTPCTIPPIVLPNLARIPDNFPPVRLSRKLKPAV